MEWVLPAEVQPLPVPQEYQGRRRIPNINFPESINTTTELIQFVSSRLGQNAQVEELQKLAFTILHHTTPRVRCTPICRRTLFRSHFQGLHGGISFHIFVIPSTRAYTETIKQSVHTVYKGAVFPCVISNPFVLN